MKKSLNEILYGAISDLQALNKNAIHNFKMRRIIKYMKKDIYKVLDVDEYNAFDIHNFILFINAANTLDLFPVKADEIDFTAPKPEYTSNPYSMYSGKLYAKTKTLDGCFEVSFNPIMHLDETEVRIEWIITNVVENRFYKDCNKLDYGGITSSKTFHSTMKSITKESNDSPNSDKEFLESGAYVLLRALFNKCIIIIITELEKRYRYYGKK